MEIIIALLLSLGFGSFFTASDSVDETLERNTPDPDDTVDPPVATDGDDAVTLTSMSDVFDGQGGDDSINGANGGDILRGGEGRDLLNGGAGTDTLFGDDGYDTLTGGTDDDKLYGGLGFDDLDGGTGDDELYGDDGKDLLVGGTGGDELVGGGWVDGLFGGEGNDILRGQNSDDLLVGGAGDDLARGGDGSDLVMGNDGADTVFGNDGDDIVVGSSLFNRELDADDFDLLRDDELPNDEDGDPFFADWFLTGTDGDTAADTLSGGAGEDTLFIGNNDVARGGADADDFLVGDWITDGNTAQITDFDTTEDIIVVAVSDANAETEVATDVVDGIGQIFIDGVLVATVAGSFDTFDGFGADVVTTSYTPAPAVAV